jgi:hypothetical protein
VLIDGITADEAQAMLKVLLGQADPLRPEQTVWDGERDAQLADCRLSRRSPHPGQPAPASRPRPAGRSGDDRRRDPSGVSAPGSDPRTSTSVGRTANTSLSAARRRQ